MASALIRERISIFFFSSLDKNEFFFVQQLSYTYPYFRDSEESGNNFFYIYSKLKNYRKTCFLNF